MPSPELIYNYIGHPSPSFTTDKRCIVSISRQRFTHLKLSLNRRCFERKSPLQPASHGAKSGASAQKIQPPSDYLYIPTYPTGRKPGTNGEKAVLNCRETVAKVTAFRLCKRALCSDLHRCIGQRLDQMLPNYGVIF